MVLDAFRLFAYGSPVSIYTLILIGGYVSSTGSGLACPDWPLCHGSIIPPLSAPVLIEYTHRVWSMVATVFVIATALLAWRRCSDSPRVVMASAIAVVLLFSQIIMGMFTVRSRLEPLMVTAHLGLASLVFAATVMTALLVYVRADTAKRAVHP